MYLPAKPSLALPLDKRLPFMKGVPFRDPSTELRWERGLSLCL